MLEESVDMEKKEGSRGSEEITFHPIGFIHSPFTERKGTPKHGSEAPEGTEGEIRLEPGYAGGLEGIKPGDRLIVLFHFHMSKGAPMTVRLRETGRETGVFNSHSPDRPNPIGISIIEVLEIDGNSIRFSGVDMVDGTPVLDIKSYGL